MGTVISTSPAWLPGISDICTTFETNKVCQDPSSYCLNPAGQSFSPIMPDLHVMVTGSPKTPCNMKLTGSQVVDFVSNIVRQKGVI